MYIDHTHLPPPPATKPRFNVPAGACDCHCHVFGPYDKFPLAPERTYGPPEAPVETYLAMLDTLGIERGVLVQASAHGMDNSAMLHAISSHPKRLRGVAVVRGSITRAELLELYQKGVRGLRFSRLLNPDGSPRYKNAVDVSEMIGLLPMMREIGMHHSYQLEGGILKYFEEVGSAHYKGSCFVFDEREALEPNLNEIPVEHSIRKKLKAG